MGAGNRVPFPLQPAEVRAFFSSEVYRRGKRYASEGRVELLDAEAVAGGFLWDLNVYGTEVYHVRLEVRNGSWWVWCTCPAFEQKEECKHLAAAMLFLANGGGQEAVTPEVSTLIRDLSEVFDPGDSTASPAPNPGAPGDRARLVVEYLLAYDGYRFVGIELKAGVDRTYVVKDLRAFLDAVHRGQVYALTPRFAYDPEVHAVSAEDLEVLAVLRAIAEEEAFYRGGMVPGVSSVNRDGRRLILSPTAAERVLAHLRGRPLYLKTENHLVRPLALAEEDVRAAQLTFHLVADEGGEGGIRLNLAPLARALHLPRYRWLVVDGVLYRLSERENRIVSAFREALEDKPWRGGSWLPGGQVREDLAVPREAVERVLTYAVPALEAIGTVRIQGELAERIVKAPLVAVVEVNDAGEALAVDVRLTYAEASFSLWDRTEPQHAGGEKLYIRDVAKERAILAVLERGPLVVGVGEENAARMFVPKDDDALYRFFSETLPELTALDGVQVYLSDAVASYVPEQPPEPELWFDLDALGDWLTVRFDVRGVDRKDVERIRRALFEGARYVRLESGAFLSLEDEPFRRARTVLTALAEKAGPQSEVKVPLHKAALLVGNEATRGVVHYSAAVQGLVEALSNPDAFVAPLPAGLRATLRPYQRTGFRWMKLLATYRLGGILADEMGLGKTVQTIAFLLSEKEEDRSLPSLVVAPSSLVYNWEAELVRFAPTLRVLVIDGSPEVRAAKLREADGADVVITSYPLLRQDIAEFARRTYAHLILDEAQAIKNPTTQTFRAVQKIRAPKRFALTGTPIENAVDELWAILQAVMPGLFPSLKAFKQLPPEEIRRRIRPFVLRRTKKDVLKDLPERTEMIRWVELDDQQKAAYLAFLQEAKREAERLMEEGGWAQNRMQILALITRLRQVCADPALVVPEYGGPSAKLEALVELLRELLAGGRRVLIFSQFARMLRRIEQRLNEEGIAAFSLDGQTPPKERMAMVEAFNAGERQVFLISLRAGGTGLNLTGADTVILYDLWWNPAVDAQAIGRAHRIGQKRPVLVFRMIAKGTIEERIYALQAEKQALFERVIESERDPLAFRLTEDDIRALLSLPGAVAAP